jgi:hypothetical protein
VPPPSRLPPSQLNAVRPRVARVQLNDLFALFPELTAFPRRPLADQRRRLRENVERMQRRAKKNVARHRLVAAQVTAASLAKRRR